jgi:hypothetical protein
MPAPFALNIESSLKAHLLTSCATVGFEGCTFTEEGLGAAMAETRLTREQCLKWAENFRERNVQESRELQLLVKRVERQVGA